MIFEQSGNLVSFSSFFPLPSSSLFHTILVFFFFFPRSDLNPFKMWPSRTLGGLSQDRLSPISSALVPLWMKLKLQYSGHLMWKTDSLEKPWCWERWKAGGEGDSRWWYGWISSPLTRWTWINSGSRWWTGQPGVLQSLGSQIVRHNWATDLNWST